MDLSSILLTEYEELRVDKDFNTTVYIVNQGYQEPSKFVCLQSAIKGQLR